MNRKLSPPHWSELPPCEEINEMRQKGERISISARGILERKYGQYWNTILKNK